MSKFFFVFGLVANCSAPQGEQSSAVKQIDLSEAIEDCTDYDYTGFDLKGKRSGGRTPELSMAFKTPPWQTMFGEAQKHTGIPKGTVGMERFDVEMIPIKNPKNRELLTFICYKTKKDPISRAESKKHYPICLGRNNPADGEKPTDAYVLTFNNNGEPISLGFQQTLPGKDPVFFFGEVNNKKSGADQIRSQYWSDDSGSDSDCAGSGE